LPTDQLSGCAHSQWNVKLLTVLKNLQTFNPQKNMKPIQKKIQKRYKKISKKFHKNFKKKKKKTETAGFIQRNETLGKGAV
jgi:hypothetical protein